MASGSHPVEVVGRIRGQVDGRDGQSALSVLDNGKSVRLRYEQGYRDFVLDGVSQAEDESLRAFYKKYVEERVEDVRAGGKCTVMMYGPTGAGKSHTMFGSAKETGVAYLALHQIMKSKLDRSGSSNMAVSANVLEIYNEEVYDLLATNCISSPGPKSSKPLLGRARLEVRGRRVKNATCISGADPAKLVQEIANVEKRRVVKSTLSNSRSSRSHCMVVLDVSGVGGRLVLVDMAGSENSDQAGCGSEAKLQTGKINQGNSALKRVVECIANGDPYIPYRDSKLTMLLQDSFEEDGAKILMVLCASRDIRDAYKTICTFEYGAKAKCIVRLPCSPPKETATFADGMEAVLQARLQYKDECIERLRQEHEQKEKDRTAKLEELAKREEELNLLKLRAEKLEEERREKMADWQQQMERMVHEKGEELRKELELEMQLRVHKLCPEDGQYRLAELEKLIEDQRQEIAVLRLRAERAESQLAEFRETSTHEKTTWIESSEVVDMDISNSICVSRDFTNTNSSSSSSYPENSYLSPPPSAYREAKEEEVSAKDQTPTDRINRNLFSLDKANCDVELPWSEIGLFKTGWLPIIPEETDEANEAPKAAVDVESSSSDEEENSNKSSGYILEPLCPNNLEKKFEKHFQRTEGKGDCTNVSPQHHQVPNAGSSSPARGQNVSCDHQYVSPERVATRKARIENIFRLCGNRREVAAKEAVVGSESGFEDLPSPISNRVCSPLSASEERTAAGIDNIKQSPSTSTEVCVKWESTKTAPGKLLCVVNIPSSSCLADLRTEIGLHVLSPAEFSFLILGDFGGAPVDKEAENALPVSSLPVCNDGSSSRRLACLRASSSKSPTALSPFKPLQNQMISPVISSKSPKISCSLPLQQGEENVDPKISCV